MAKEMTIMTMSGAPSDLADSTLLAISSDSVSREVVLSFRNSVRGFRLRATGVDELLGLRVPSPERRGRGQDLGRDSDARKLRDSHS